MVNVTWVTDDSTHLAEVKALWRQNSESLGFFPNGAFEERARKRQILGAIENERLIGYVLYYSTRSARVRITHLCVADNYRGHGIARALISRLQTETRACLAGQRHVSFDCSVYCWSLGGTDLIFSGLIPSALRRFRRVIRWDLLA